MSDQNGGSGPYLTKDDFHEYVIDNRDRQDRNKLEIIQSLSVMMKEYRIDCEDDYSKIDRRVEKLEDYQKKQNVLAVIIGAISAALLAFLK
jgi:hypothetical protein